LHYDEKENVSQQFAATVVNLYATPRGLNEWQQLPVHLPRPFK